MYTEVPAERDWTVCVVCPFASVVALPAGGRIVSSLPRVPNTSTVLLAMASPQVFFTVVVRVTLVALSAGADAVVGEMDDLAIDGLLSFAKVTLGFAVSVVPFIVAETVRLPGTHEVMSK